MKEIIDKILKELEDYRDLVNEKNDFPPSDHLVRVCEAIVARYGGYDDRWSWKHLQRSN